MQDFVGKKILLGISGGIAAYKSAYLVRALHQLGASIRVVMTGTAQAFVSPMTFQALSGHDVRCELFDAQAERAMGHIELARWADYLVIAPASANTMAKMAQGLADDLLSTLYLVSEVPCIISPAMNRSMWQHPATQANYSTLSKRGAIFVGPDEGSQACGETGLGRMSEIEHIVTALRQLSALQKLVGKKVLITAGPTQEAIDPVRYVTNRSSGKMGYALASAAKIAGADVTLISGPTHLSTPIGVRCFNVNTAEEMKKSVMSALEKNTVFIGSAAVSDYRLKEVSPEKIKKGKHSQLTLVLEKNPDIIAEVKASGLASCVVGFAAETHHVIEYAEKKLKQKKLDMIVANQVGEGLGFDTNDNQVTLISNEGKVSLPLMEKNRLAAEIMVKIAELCN